MYQLTDNPDCVQRIEDGACIPRGHRWWDEYEAWLAAGNTPDPIPAPTMGDLVADVKRRMTNMLDSEVQTHGYDNIVSCASYANSTDAIFKAEAEAAIAWRDEVYRKGYEILADIPEGVTTPEDVIALLPQMEWPA